MRTEIARERKVPPYVVFSDATLRDLARRRPVTPAAFLAVHGVGEKKLADLGEVFLSHIQSNSSDHDQTGASEPEPDDGSSNDAEHRQTVDAGRVPSKNLCPAKRKAFELFAALKEIDEVMGEIDRAHSTTVGYLADFIAIYRPERIDAWVDDETYELAADAALNVGARLLKPIHEFLKEQVAYDDIRLVVSHLEAMDMESPTSNEPP